MNIFKIFQTIYSCVSAVCLFKSRIQPFQEIENQVGGISNEFHTKVSHEDMFDVVTMSRLVRRPAKSDSTVIEPTFDDPTEITYNTTVGRKKLKKK